MAGSGDLHGSCPVPDPAYEAVPRRFGWTPPSMSRKRKDWPPSDYSCLRIRRIVWSGTDRGIRARGIAIDYVCANSDELRKPSSCPGLDTFTIGLHYRLELTRSFRGLFVRSTKRLMEIALDIGADIGFYVVLLTAGTGEGGLELPGLVGEWFSCLADTTSAARRDRQARAVDIRP